MEHTIIYKFDALIELSENLELTKRNLLKIIAKFFDPLGMLSPLTSGMKVLFQEVCQSNLEWDERLLETFQERWRKSVVSLKEVRSVQVPRCIYSGISAKVVSYELHGFGDASDRAYCAMVYLVCVTYSGRHVRLMASKTKVAPLAKRVKARLELKAGRIAAQLKDAVEKALQSRIAINSAHLWSDCITALCWIKGEREWSQFVQNRVKEILRLTTREQWNHCPGVENPADLGSRGVTATTIKNSSLWWQGPEWLSTVPEKWPSMNVEPTPKSQVEIRGSPSENTPLAAETEEEMQHSKHHRRERLQQLHNVVQSDILYVQICKKPQVENKESGKSCVWQPDGHRSRRSREFVGERSAFRSYRSKEL